MIWQYEHCMLCGKDMQLSKNSEIGDSIKLYRCPNKVIIPDNIYSSIKNPYIIDDMDTHFEVEYQNYKPFYQEIKIFPFVLAYYMDSVYICKYNNNLHITLVAKVATLDLPWKNIDKVIKKLNTYVLFS